MSLRFHLHTSGRVVPLSLGCPLTESGDAATVDDNPGRVGVFPKSLPLGMSETNDGKGKYMPYFNANGISAYYEIHGSGEPLLLLHHGTGCTQMWEKLLPGFASRYQVILYDRRGFGKSDRGENFEDYYLGDDYCEQSVMELSALLDHLNIRKDLSMVGQCEGGAIAFHYAAQNPGKVNAVVSSSTLCYSKVTVYDLCKGKVFSSFDEAEPDFQKKMTLWHGEAYAPELYSLFLKMGGAYGAGVFDLREVLHKVQCPALVLYPDRSGLFEVEQGVLMYRALPKGELAVLPNCGHNTYAQQPEDYQRLILSFLERS